MRYAVLAAAFASMLGFSSGASAATIAFTNYGQSDGRVSNPGQPVVSSLNAVNWVGQPGACGLSNCGWDPFGTADTTHNWIDIGNSGGSLTFNLSDLSSSIKNHVLYVVWGSPNGDNTVRLNDPSSSSLTTAGLGPTFNYQNHPAGYLLGLNVAGATTISFSTNETAFEFAFTSGVPEPSTWAMMLVGLAGLGMLGRRTARRRIGIA